MWKSYRQNATDFYLEENEWHTSINVPSENFAENGLFLTLNSQESFCYFDLPF